MVGKGKRMKPTLTHSRWYALLAMHTIDGPFQAKDIRAQSRTMSGCARAGWIERVAVENNTPFALPKTAPYYRVTAAGREAIAALPKTPPKKTYK
jgi:hypothetical protein